MRENKAQSLIAMMHLAIIAGIATIAKQIDVHEKKMTQTKFMPI